jgi:hypothetical protein
MSKVKLFAIIVFVSVLTACGSTFAERAFCRDALINQFEKSDGASAPYDLELSDNQIVVIEYAAEWETGKVVFEIWDDAGIPVWSSPAQKTATRLTIKTTPLKAGKYRLVNVANNATNGTVCMLGKVE